MRQDISQCPACTNRQQPENMYMHMISWCRFQTILCPRPTKDQATISKYMSIFIIRTSENFIIWNEVKDFFIVVADGHTFEHDICFFFSLSVSHSLFSFLQTVSVNLFLPRNYPLGKGMFHHARNWSFLPPHKYILYYQSMLLMCQSEHLICTNKANSNFIH